MAQQQASETQGKCPFCGAKFTVPALGALPGATAGAIPGEVPQAGPGGAVGKEWGLADAKETWIGFAIGVGFLFAALLVLFPFKGTYFADLFLDRGWVPYVLLLFMGWAIGIMILKWRRLKIERRALIVDMLPPNISDTITPAERGTTSCSTSGPFRRSSPGATC